MEGGKAQPWGAPQTRVSENGDGKSSTFDAGDRFAVQIDGKEEVGTYTVQDDHTVRAETPLYWYDRNDHTVTAWYPATDGTIDLIDQSQSLAYLLSGTGTGKYPDPVTLNFTHALAKVRITPSDDALGEVQSLQLYTYTQCTYEKGNAGQGSQEGWIEMKKCEYTESGATTCWEANVVPGYAISRLRANGTEERDLSSAFTPEAGVLYNITLDKDKGYTDDGQGNYTVTSAEGLKAVADIANNGNLGINITLTENINLTDMDWTPIGIDYNHQYTGTFNGGGHTITGLTVTGSDKYVGLFGHIGSGGTVKDVTLEEVKIESNNDMSAVGGVAGRSYGTLENCSVSGSVSGSGIAGGVVGYQSGGFLTGCSSSATVNAGGVAGGVAGLTDSGATLTACYATGDVPLESINSGGNFVGGVAGRSYGTLENCSVSGSVSGSGIAGGVVGYQSGGFLTGCSSSATVNAGGVAGGVAGLTDSGATLTACYATGDVPLESINSGGNFVGGVVGSNTSCTLKACYAWGSVTGSGSGTIYVGGVTGTNDEGTLTACYHANGTVSGPAGTTGGVTGRNYKFFNDPVITACYW